MKAQQVANRLLETYDDRTGRWWDLPGEEGVSAEELKARFDAKQARREQQSRMQRLANRIGSFEPNTQELVQQVAGRDDLLKERKARLRFQAELAKHDLRVDEVEGMIYKERETKDTLLRDLHQGQAKDNQTRCAACPHNFASVQTGDLVGVRARGKVYYFSEPVPGMGLPPDVVDPRQGNR